MDRVCAIYVAVLILVISSLMLVCTSCTLSFSNVSTHGSASDVIDEDQTASPSTELDASIPAL